MANWWDGDGYKIDRHGVGWDRGNVLANILPTSMQCSVVVTRRVAWTPVIIIDLQADIEY